jgi:hypothetical protein
MCQFFFINAHQLCLLKTMQQITIAKKHVSMFNCPPLLRKQVERGRTQDQSYWKPLLELSAVNV